VRNIKTYLLILIYIVSIGMQFVQANEQFQNNLLKMDIYKTSLGGIKVTLYTNKPYADSVFVNKKTDTEYVILLPETLNSMTAKPTLTPVSDVVKDVQVKTQQYDAQGKGYTKITIATSKPIEITSKVQALNIANYQLTQKDYNELIKQVGKKSSAINSKKIQVKPTKTEAKKSKPIISPQVKPILVKAKNVVKPQGQKPLPKVTKKEPVAKTIASEAPIALKPEKNVLTPKENIQQTEVVAPIVNPSTEAMTAPINEPTATSPLGNILGKFEQYKNIIKNNIYIALGLLIATLLLLLLGARRMIRNMKEQKKVFASNLKDKPSTVKDYSENISEDMSWKEKFQTYVENTNEETTDTSGQQEASENPELNNLFSEEIFGFEVEEAQSEQEITNEWEIKDQTDAEIFGQSQAETSSLNEFLTEQDDIETISIDALFSEDETDDEFDEAMLGEVQEEDNIVKSEFKIDDSNGFYLVDFEDTSALIGHIDDEVFVLKRFSEKVDDKIQARMNEKTGNKTSYMTKVGRFRALVEVTPDNMNLLIEL